jgi:hypothetical protein
MKDQKQTVQKLFELANHYPSPHNGQPVVVRQIDNTTFELNFQKERGLQAAEVSLLFSYVAMGVFTQHLDYCTQALGHRLSYRLELPRVSSIKGVGLVNFATCKVEFDAREPNRALHKTLLFRQTSRKKYSKGLSEDLTRQSIAVAAEKHMQLVKMDRAGAHQAIWLNQRAVFDDMFDDAVRHELNHWLRYSRAEKESKKDGLSYDCMELNGWMMRFIVKNYGLLRWPGISGALRRYYLRTMSDNSDVFYLLTPFSTEQEAFDVGVTVMHIWKTIAEKGYYLHPFGTIMSNAAAHNDFLKLAGIEHEDKTKNFLVFIYRTGRSEKPNSSMRIPIQEHLLEEAHV